MHMGSLRSLSFLFTTWRWKTYSWLCYFDTISSYWQFTFKYNKHSVLVSLFFSSYFPCDIGEAHRRVVKTLEDDLDEASRVARRQFKSVMQPFRKVEFKSSPLHSITQDLIVDQIINLSRGTSIQLLIPSVFMSWPTMTEFLSFSSLYIRTSKSLVLLWMENFEVFAEKFYVIVWFLSGH